MSNFPGRTLQFSNLFLEDQLGRSFFRAWLGEQHFPELVDKFEEMGARAARAQDFSADADREPPTVPTPSSPTRDIGYIPAYRELESLAFTDGLIALKYDAEFRSRFKDVRQTAGFGLGYYFAQTEIGLYCPVCMTDGVASVLEKHAPEPLVKRVLPYLAAKKREELWQGAMFLTERHAGSDVGACSVQARLVDGSWLLDGEKWFCSNADAEAILVLARMPEGKPGTEGLGLFLVLRDEPVGNAETVQVERLKPKLGVRSMPTAELVLKSTRAHLIGEAGKGFKQMAEMLNLSRLYNAVASIAGMRRAVLEAGAYGRRRSAFGNRLDALPLWKASMQDVIAEQIGAFVLVFEAVRALDAAENGDEASAQLIRLLIPMVKALTGKLSVFVVSECMEAIGGNAYIEDSIMPRLLRDCQVLPIWEGTTNILCLDVMRALEKPSIQKAFINRVEALIQRGASAQGVATQWLAQTKSSLDANCKMLEELKTCKPERAERLARSWVESAGRTLTKALLLAHTDIPDLNNACRAAYMCLSGRPFSSAPVSSSAASLTPELEDALMNAAYSEAHG